MHVQSLSILCCLRPLSVVHRNQHGCVKPVGLCVCMFVYFILPGCEWRWEYLAGTFTQLDWGGGERWNKGKSVQQAYGGTEMIDKLWKEKYTLVFNNMPHHWGWKIWRFREVHVWVKALNVCHLRLSNEWNLEISLKKKKSYLAAM